MSSLLTLGLIGLIGFLCQWFSYKVKLPAILFLLLVGILLGPVFGVFNPNELFGDLLFPFISLSVAVILFEGALTLKRNELKEIGRPVRRMVTVGVIVNGAIMTIATYYIIGLSWGLSALFGALMVVTGPTVIMPMLKTVRPTPKIADVLRWEGIVIDPIGALIAVLVYEWIVVQESTAGISEIFYVFGATVAVGFALGLAAGYLFGLLLRNHYIPEKLHNFASLAVVCFVFAASDSLLHESGLLAVTVMGMVLANMRDVHVHSILEFKEDLTVDGGLGGAARNCGSGRVCGICLKTGRVRFGRGREACAAGVYDHYWHSCVAKSNSQTRGQDVKGGHAENSWSSDCWREPFVGCDR